MAVKTALKVRSGTRERVLDVSLALFNTNGLDRVTTAEIADAAGINEGNLYYYFQRKEHLAAALFGRFADALIDVAERRLADPSDLACYFAYQRGWFDLMWDFRFLYRDAIALRAMAPGLRDQLAGITRAGQAELRRVFTEMHAHGLLAATAEEIDVLIGNLWIVSSYWMDFRAEELGHANAPADLAWGYRQVEMLVRPYLAQKARPGG